jgi:hypothetical protein
MEKDDPMRTMRLLALALLTGAIASASAGATPVLAQDAAVLDAATLEAAVTGHERAADRTRARLGELLAHDGVRAIAERRGLDMERVEERAGTLSDRELAQVEPLVAEASAAMAQSNTITISVYTIIILLLILILIT